MDFNELAKDQSQDQLQEFYRTIARSTLVYYSELVSCRIMPENLQNSLTEIFTEIYLRRTLLNEVKQ